jgi:hypothetical protein
MALIVANGIVPIRFSFVLKRTNSNDPKGFRIPWVGTRSIEVNQFDLQLILSRLHHWEEFDRLVASSGGISHTADLK